MTDWFVVQTNPNCERKAAAELRRAGYRVHVPKFARVFIHRRSKKPMINRRPAMPGYIFMRFAQSSTLYPARKCQGVKGVLYADGKPFVLARREVEAVMRAQRRLEYDAHDARTYRQSRRRGEKRNIATARFSEGMKVRTSNGPLANIVARVQRVTDRGTVVAVAEIMGTQRTVEFQNTEHLEVEDELV